MARMLVIYLLLVFLFPKLDCEVYQDRPKIKTSDGDLILEPAYDKSIFLRRNGPKSAIFVGEVNILDEKSKPEKNIVHNQEPPNNELQDLLNGPNGILKRLENLESKTIPVPDGLLLNITTLWRNVNDLSRKTNNIHLHMIIILLYGEDKCQPQPCQHGGTCVSLDNSYHCFCPNNWEGKDCDNDVNECRNIAGTDLGCQNGATCINKPGYYECLCRSGWFGLHCTRKAKDCSGGDFEMCGHGTCLKTNTGDGVACICHQGWNTNGTGVACLTDINECDSHQGARCSVNPKVECINLPGSFRCGQCPQGYEGDGYTCADIDECVTITNGGCSPMVACHNTIGSRICGPCPSGYQGDGVTCSWKGSCNIEHGGCHPTAQCVENVSLGRTAQCVCPNGMDGDGVGIHGCYISVGDNNTASCDNSPCGAHGQCHILRSGYTCICQKGYGGPHCDANICAINPCRNGGICRQDDNTPTGVRCECTAQYSGPLCQVLTRSCGGLLDAEEGSIVYPLTNTTYVHDSRCAWVIQTVPSKVINVTFSKFSLEDGTSDCLYDFLQIHDGRSSASQLIGRFCGNVLPKGGNIVSSQHNLYLWFRSDSTIAKEGFVLHWTSVDPICGGIIDAGIYGRISSPGSPGKYPPNRDCYWKLRAPLGKKIELHFFALDFEHHNNCSFDYLAIYDGSRQSDPLLNQYCDSTQPAPLTSAGSYILIHFHSDAYGDGLGFQLAYASVPGVPGCGGYFTTERGEITAPMFNGAYLNNMLCEYKIKTSQGSRIRLHFRQFNLEKSIRCNVDYLKIYDGPSEESPLVGKFCGTMYPKSYVATSNTLLFKFRSNFARTAGGFKISYEALCQQTLFGDSGVIKSPRYPFNYPENQVCEYFIATSPGKAIQLTFQDFNIEGNRSQSCRYDNVEIRDGADVNSTLLGIFCGDSKHIPPVQLSTHNHLYVRFHSDMSVSGTGFYANYTTFVTECGGIYTKTTGLINHPASGSPYKNNQECSWILMAPEGKHIKLTWHRFELENSSPCGSTDYLELIEMDDNNTKYTIGKYCGTKTPPVISTSTNRFMIKFKSDYSIRSSGFSVSYTFLDDKSDCGGFYYRSHGFIYSPGWPQRYERNRDCTWVITVPVGQQIRLNISQFDVDRGIRSECSYGDFLELKNGATPYSPLLGQFCGKFKSKIITSIANRLYIHFHSKFAFGGNGFRLEWDGSITGCGGTLTSSSGSISSPNFPDSYNENTECFYRIVTNSGTRIRLAFTDLELEQTPNCRDDYVEIFDGKNADFNSLGKQCHNFSPGLRNIETTSNYAFIKFRSDWSIGGKGFFLNYVTLCNNDLSGSYGVIESPGYPDNYPLNSNCLWNINVSKGNRINVTFTHFDVFESRFSVEFLNYVRRYYPDRYSNLGGCADYLQWKENTETKYSDKMCGTTAPPMITSNSNSLQIKFASKSFGSGTGFRLEWVRSGCGGHIQKRSGFVSVDRSAMSSEELECEWLIETPIGTQVSLHISDLFLKESSNCSVDVIEIYNGQNTKSPLLSRICNHHITSVVDSTANVMLVKYTKHSDMKGAYFTSSFYASEATCGGLIELLSGYIYSPNYPNNYDSNLDCRWLISVPTSYRIELNFMDFDLHSNFDADCGDSIKIFDNTYWLESSNYTSLICPASNIRQITSKNNILMIQLTTDNNGNAKGFKVKFSVACGASITASNDGIISNDNFIGGANESCLWTIRAPKPDQKISLTVTYIFLPAAGDVSSNRSCSSTYLRVFDGDDIDAPLVDEYCGKKAPPMIVSRGSALTVLLDSYINYTVGHFSAHYTPLSEACGGVFTSEEGTIASPNYPRSYPIGANCEWTLSTSPGSKVYIIFEQFDLEYSEKCNEDYLEIRQDNSGGPILGVYCGTEVPTNTTTASKLYIKFHSSDMNSGKGFVLHYGFLHGNELINMESGEIASPSYPNLYHGASVYSWRIQSKGNEDIDITIDQLEIPSYGQICNNYLSIYDGYDDTAPLLGQLCGKLFDTNKVFQTSSNMAFIKLSLDESNTGSLFHLQWEKKNVDANTDKEEVNCGSNYTEIIPPGNFSMFVSPHYPENYDNDLTCEWTFQASSGRHLKMKFTEFSLEESSECRADYVNIYSSDIPGHWKQMKQKICTTESALLETDSDEYLKVELKTDSTVTRKGFQGKVTSVCGGQITDSSGEVGPIWDDIHMSSNTSYEMKCEWTIKVRSGRLIDLKFKHFNISNTDDHCFTSVTLKNGDSKEAPLLGHYCGHSLEKVNGLKLTTSSNVVFISYSNDLMQYDVIGFQTFKIRYEEQNIECGVSSRLDNEQSWEVISSTNYPETPVPYSECIWKFIGPPGEILRIDFIDRFDLEKEEDCEYEFVELRDGLSSLSPSLGQLCGETPQTIHSTSNTLYVRYLTQIPEPRNGFKANVSIDVCGGTIVAEHGEIKSPGYPHMINIPYATVCEWRIKGDPSNVFKITTQDINLPETEKDCATNVTIEEQIPGTSSSTVLVQYCDMDSPKGPVETSTNDVVIKYHHQKPNEWSRGVQSRGFRFTFTSFIPTCGGIIRTPEGFLTTPAYPSVTILEYCNWYIVVPDKTHRVRLEIIDADANKHTIGIYNDNAFQSLIQSIPGAGYSPTTRVYESSGNVLSIYLWLNSQASNHRFKARFSSGQAALCGGNLNGASGELSSPNLERSYSCEWHYNSRIGSEDREFNTILLTARVSSNSSIARRRCLAFDPKLIIKARLTNQGVLFYRELCAAAAMQATYRISSSVLDIKAIKSSNSSLYFHLDYKSQPCGGLVNIGENALDILEIPNSGNGTLDCAWVLLAPYDNRMELKMEGIFQYDCDDEFLKISQSASQFAPALGDYCKRNTLDKPLITNFKLIYIEYHTKAKNSSSLKLLAKTVNGQCGREMSADEYQKVFHSPNYPNSYDPNLECAWIITADLGNRISLRFIDRFVVEDTLNCSKDAVIIYDWKDDAYNEIGRACGRPVHMSMLYNSTNNKLKVVFRTDATTNLDGFKASWTLIYGGNYLATDKKQTLLSPGFPSQYPAMADFTYKIRAPLDKKLLVEFLEFDLEGTLPLCQYDNVTVTGEEGYTYINAVYCGTDLPPAITAFNEITISFKSDRYTQKRGFKLTYQINECGSQVTEPTTLTSHYGRDVYDNNMNCTWLIEAPTNKLVVLKFLYIDLEKSRECYSDSVAVFDGLMVDDSKRLALLCGLLNSTTIIRSHGNTVLLQFVTDQSFTSAGFKVEVLFTYGESAGCGGRFNLERSSVKTFKSPIMGTNTSAVYENYLDCHWTITSPPDTAIQMEFIYFRISPCLHANETAVGLSKCDCDFVEIIDGLNPDSFIMGTYCGHTLPPTQHSSGNLMSIRLSTDGELNSSGFKVRLSVQQSLCGQSRFTLGENATRIKSPGYETGTIARGIRCVYYLEVSPGENTVVRLSMLHIDLQPPSDLNGHQLCDKDKVIVASSPATRNVSIGEEYVVNSAPSFITSHYTYAVVEDAKPKRMEYCGSTKSSDVYFTGSITLTLVTSPDSDSKPYKGIDFEFALSGFCGKNYTGTQGKIQTPFFYRSHSYRRYRLYNRIPGQISSHQNKDCYTLITAPANHTISAYFVSVNPENRFNNVYLDVFDGNDTSANKMVTFNREYDTDLALFSTGRYMLLHNHGFNNIYVQYEMNYVSSEQRGCGGRLATQAGRVTSPMYPDVYRQVSKCEWELETPVGTRLKLHFNTFDVGRSCEQNYLQLVDGRGNVVSSFCAEAPADYTSSDNFVKIVFYTTNNNGGPGWVADFVGGEEQDPGIRFTSEPSDLVVVAGEPALLTCGAITRHAMRLAWRHSVGAMPTRDHALSSDDKYRKQLPNGSLVIESMTSSLAGQYQCVASVDGVGTIVSRIATVFLADVPELIPGPRSVLGAAGGVALLPCGMRASPRVALRVAASGAADRRVYGATRPHAAPPPLRLNVTWLKNGSPVRMETARVSLTPSGALEIDPLKHHDAATYRCRVDLLHSASAYMASKTSRVSEEIELRVSAEVASVESPPRFIATPQPLTIMEGASVTFDCAATGNPKPEITWLNNGVAIDLSDLDSRFYLVGSGSLRVQSARALDAGAYTCRAHSRLDSTDHTTQLHVQTAPRVSVPSSVVSARARGDVTLRCEARGRPPPTVMWLKDGDLLTPNNHEVAIVDGSSLRIQGVLRVDAGMFQCACTSPAGAAAAALRLRVLPPADVVPSNSTHDILTSLITVDSTLDPSPEDSNFLGETSSAYTPIPDLEYEDYYDFHAAKGLESEANTTIVSAPKGLKAVIVKHRFVTLSWEAPENGSEDVTGYAVIYRVKGSERERVAMGVGQRHEMNVASLQPNTSYQFSILANTRHGASPRTEVIEVTTPSEEGLHGPPQNVRVETVGPHALRVTWSPPAPRAPPAPHPSQYTVHYTEIESGREQFQLVEVAQSLETLSHTLGGLRAATPYSVSVSAGGAAGAGAAVPARTAAAPPAAPPANLTAVPAGPTSIIVRWEAPPSRTHGGPLTGYKVRYRAGAGAGAGGPGPGARRKADSLTTPANARRAELRDLDTATTYQIRVSAINANGSGPFSEWVTATTHAQQLDETKVPPQPPPLTTRAGRDWISVWWSEEGVGGGGVVVRGYLLGWGLGVPDEMSRTLPHHIHSHVIRNLESNAEYVLSLRASNSAGLGPAVYGTVRTRPAAGEGDDLDDPGDGGDMDGDGGEDDEGETGDPAPLIPPVGLKAIMLSGSTAVVYWTDPTLPKGQGATDGRRYVVRWSPAGGGGAGGGAAAARARYFNATDLNCMLDELKPHTQYEFSVKLIKGGRESAWSMLVVNTTLEVAPGGPPRELRVAPAGSSAARAVDLTWLPPAKPNGVITGYVIMYAVSRGAIDAAGGAGAGGEEWTAVAAAGERGRARVDRLRPRTTYLFKVQARNSRGLGPFCPPVPYTTPMEAGEGGGLASATSAWLWASAGGACAVLALAAALALSLCCRRGTPPLSPDTSTYQKSSASAALKPPDLWIHHDQMELKHMDKGLHTSASKISAGSVDGSALVSSTLTLGRTPPAPAEYEPARHPPPPPASLDRRHYVPTYVESRSPSVAGSGSDDTAILRASPASLPTCARCEYTYKPMTGMGVGVGIGGVGGVGCAATCDRRHRMPHPDQSTPLLAGVAPLGSAQSSLASLHPAHPAHVAPPPAPCGSGGCPLGAACGAAVGPGGPGGGGDIYACAARERGHYVAYEPLGHYTHRDSVSSEAGPAVAAGGSLQRRAPCSAPLHSFALSDNVSDHSTPTHSHSRGSVRETSPYKKSASSSPGHIPNRLQLGGVVPHCAEELEPLTPSRSTERLHREMQNLEGLMKDLSAITQHQFHC